MLKLILGIFLLASAYFGYNYYQTSRIDPTISVSTPNLVISHTPQLGQIASVLGDSISTAIESGKGLLNEATNGASDPIINRALTNIQNEVKDLPQEAVDKVKYEFCKDVVTEYENR